MDNFYKKLNEECDVRFPYPNEQDWEWCAGDYIYTNDYIEFYKFYATVIDDWQKHLLINMIVQGIEDFMEQSEDEGYIDMLWSKVKEIFFPISVTKKLDHLNFERGEPFKWMRSWNGCGKSRAHSPLKCRFAEKVMKDFGRVDYLIHNALPLMKGIDECSYEEFNYALRVTAPLLSDKTVPALLFSSWGHCQYLFLPGSYEPAADRKLYDRQRRDFCSYPRPGRQPDRKGSG